MTLCQMPGDCNRGVLEAREDVAVDLQRETNYGECPCVYFIHMTSDKLPVSFERRLLMLLIYSYILDQ